MVMGSGFQSLRMGWFKGRGSSMDWSMVMLRYAML